MCLASDACLTADPGVTSLIPARSHTFMEFDHKIISTVILLPLPLNHSRRVVVSYKQKYMHEVLVNHLLKLAQEKVWLGELTVPAMTIAVDWDVKQQNKQTKNHSRRVVSYKEKYVHKVLVYR